MRKLRALVFRIVGQFRRWSADRSIAAEIDSHLELHIADNIRAGMTPDEARRRALVALGGVEPTKERVREQQRLRLVREFLRDMALAVRTLRQDRSFTMTAAFVLGIGLAVSNTFFILMNAIVLRGLPIDEPERVLMVRARDAADRNLGMSYEDFRDMRASIRSLDGLAAFTWAPMTIGDANHAAERFVGAYISADVFATIGERAIAGRDFQPSDDVAGAPPVVILGRSVWESRYGGDRSIVGATIRVNGRPATVVGIMPDRSKFMTNAVVWQPLGALPGISQQSRGSRQLDAFGRLASGASPAAAQEELQSKWAALQRAFPATNAGIRLAVAPISHHYVGDRSHPAWLAFIAAGFLVLAVACANVANLLIVRGTSRAREMAVRSSLGATRMRLVRQLLAESTVIAALGGAIGCAVSVTSARLLWLIVPEGTLPHWMHFTMDPPMFAVLAAVCLGAAMLSGVIPALQASKVTLNPVLNSGIRGASGGVPARWLTSVFLVAQFAIAFGSLISISATARRVADTNGVPEATAKGLMTMSIAVPAETYTTPERRNDFYQRLHQHLSNVAGITGIAFASNLPVGGAATRALVREDTDPNATGPRPMVRSVSISPGYFETLQVPLLRGREFTEQDGTAEPAPAIVNRRFLELHLANAEPLGAPLTVVIDSVPRRFTIVGVSPTIRQRPGPEGDPVVYFPQRATAPLQMAIIVRASVDLSEVAPALRGAMRTFDADIPLYRMMTLEEAIAEVDWNARFSNIIAGIAGMLAVLLAAIGLFAMTAHAVALMTPEIGIRAALGARPHQVLSRVLRRAAIQLLFGIGAGTAFVFVWHRIFSGAQSPSDVGPDDFIIAAGLLTVVALAACLVPVSRALRINPIVALRYD